MHWPQGYNFFHAQLMSVKLVLVISFKMATIVGILKFITGKMTKSADLGKKIVSFV